MVKELLTAAGIQERGSRFVKPPSGTYAVWFDNTETDGPDNLPDLILRHSTTVELYEPRKDDAAEAAFEAQLSAAGLDWTKQDRTWIQSEQLYQVIYEFDYIVKKEDVTNGQER